LTQPQRRSARQRRLPSAGQGKHPRRRRTARNHSAAMAWPGARFPQGPGFLLGPRRSRPQRVHRALRVGHRCDQLLHPASPPSLPLHLRRPARSCLAGASARPIPPGLLWLRCRSHRRPHGRRDDRPAPCRRTPPPFAARLERPAALTILDRCRLTSCYWGRHSTATWKQEAPSCPLNG